MLLRLSYELLVVSDVHISAMNDTRGELFLNMLRSIDSTRLKYLVLLGDIFDFCFGGSEYFSRKYAAVASELERLSSEGVRVFFVEGNHEFMLQELGWKGVQFMRAKALCLDLPQGPRVAFIHGDELENSWHYRLYASLIRSRLSRFMASKLPQAFLDKLALSISAKSRQRSYLKPVDENEVVSKIKSVLEQNQAQVGIVGHFHIPFCAQFPDSSLQVLGLDSWDKPNCLGFDGKDFYRIYFKDNKTESQLIQWN